MNELGEDPKILSNFLDNMPVPVFLFDQHYTFIRVSQKMAELHDCSPNELEGKAFWDVFTDESLNKIIRDTKQMIETGQTICGVHSVDVHGESKTFRTWLFPVDTHHNHVKLYGGISVDISKNKSIEKELMVEQRRFESIIEATNFATWEWGVNTNKTIYNQRWGEMLGYDADEPLPTTNDEWRSRIHPLDLIENDKLLQEHLEGKSSLLIDTYRIKNKQGNWVWILDRGKVTSWSADGKPLIMQGIMHDVTEEKKAERTLIELNHELKMAHEQSLFMAEKAQQASKAKDLFLAKVSHEIRTPLNAIIGFSELLNHTALDGKQERYTRQITQASESLLALINGLLDYAQIESGKMKLYPEEFDLLYMLESTIEMHRVEAQKKEVGLHLNIAENLPKCIVADKKRLEQVVNNLIDNAIKFTEHGHVTLDVSFMPLSETRGSVDVRVIDTGIGFDQEKNKHIFEAFQQIGELNEKSKSGVGLGLAISSQIINAMGSTITCESTPGHGSQFQFSIEVDFNGQPNVINTGSLKSLKDEFIFANHQKEALRVLVVEDNDINREMITDLMSTLFQGCQVVEAINGKEALEALKCNEFDLILMDIHMPVMDGREALEKMLSDKLIDLKTTPVFALSAGSTEVEMKECLNKGFTEYLTKPIQTDALIGALKKHLPIKHHKAIDVQALLDKVGDEQELKKRISQLKAYQKEQFKALQNAFECEDRNAMRQIAHAFKGVMSVFGADGAANVLNLLEQQSGDQLMEEMEPLLNKLQQEIDLIDRQGI